MQPSDESPNIIKEIDNVILSNLNNNMIWDYSNNKKKISSLYICYCSS